MKEKDRLQSQILKLGQSSKQTSDGKRDILSGNDFLGSVLREIDDTILHRSLTIASAAGSISLVAANRRLMSVNQIAGDGMEEANALVGLSLTRPDVADLGRLRDALASLFEGADWISVESQTPQGATPGFSDGTTAAALASAWGVTLAAKTDTPSAEAEVGDIEDFMGKLPTLSEAWLRLKSGMIANEGGDPSFVAKLRAFADSAELADLVMRLDSEEQRFVSIGRAPDDGANLVFASDGDDSALLIVSAEKLAETRASWKSAAT